MTFWKSQLQHMGRQAQGGLGLGIRRGGVRPTLLVAMVHQITVNSGYVIDGLLVMLIKNHANKYGEIMAFSDRQNSPSRCALEVKRNELRQEL